MTGLDLTTSCKVGDGARRPDGYRQVYVDGRLLLAHRVAYERAHGPIPAGLVIDHACHNADPDCPGGPTCPHRECDNVAHLQAVGRGANVADGAASRATCDRGHPWTDATTYRRTNGRRQCRPCAAERARERRANRG